MEKFEYNLADSGRIIQLYPVLVDQHGKVIDGLHRKTINPKWKREVITIEPEKVEVDATNFLLKEEAVFYRTRLFANMHRREMTATEKTVVLRHILQHTQPRPTLIQLAKIAEISVPSIYRYVPEECLDPRGLGRPRAQLTNISQPEKLGSIPMPTVEEACTNLSRTISIHLDRLLKEDLPTLFNFIEETHNCPTCPASECCGKLTKFYRKWAKQLPSCMRHRLSAPDRSS